MAPKGCKMDALDKHWHCGATPQVSDQQTNICWSSISTPAPWAPPQPKLCLNDLRTKPQRRQRVVEVIDGKSEAPGQTMIPPRNMLDILILDDLWILILIYTNVGNMLDDLSWTSLNLLSCDFFAERPSRAFLYAAKTSKQSTIEDDHFWTLSWPPAEESDEEEPCSCRSPRHARSTVANWWFNNFSQDILPKHFRLVGASMLAKKRVAKWELCSLSCKIKLSYNNL